MKKDNGTNMVLPYDEQGVLFVHKNIFKKLVSKIYELVSYRINLMKTFFISELKLFSICLAAYIEYSGKSM